MRSILKDKSKIQPILPGQPNNSNTTEPELTEDTRKPNPAVIDENTHMDSSIKPNSTFSSFVYVIPFPTARQQHRVSASSKASRPAGTSFADLLLAPDETAPETWPSSASLFQMPPTRRRQAPTTAQHFYSRPGSAAVGQAKDSFCNCMGDI
jgi:hypothetical protein